MAHSHVLVDLVLSAIALEHPPEDACASHPDHLHRQTRVGSTLALTRASVAALALRGVTAVFPVPRVHGLQGPMVDHKRRCNGWLICV